MRKLAEARKLSSSIDDRSVNCRIFPANSDEITIGDNHRVNELYDLSQANPQIGSAGKAKASRLSTYAVR
jgi:hypothetical protein